MTCTLFVTEKGRLFITVLLSIKFAGCLTEFRLSRVGYYLKYYLAIHFQLESGSLGSTDKKCFRVKEFFFSFLCL